MGPSTAASTMFSRTVSRLKMPMFSGTKAMPLRAMRGVGWPVMSSPRKRTLPWVTVVRPMMVRSVVLLPAPLRPSSTVSSPAGTSRSTPCRMWY